MIQNNIRIERIKLSFTQAELAELLSVDSHTINSIEEGKFIPSVEIALKIAQVFNTSVENIFTLK